MCKIKTGLGDEFGGIRLRNRSQKAEVSSKTWADVCSFSRLAESDCAAASTSKSAQTEFHLELGLGSFSL
jgi:hypothetical protein